MQSQPDLIEIKNATIWRGNTRVFSGLNLTIGQQEQLAIIGPNGCGKTTLLKTINRELYPVASSDSHVRILGKDRWNVWELRKQIGVVSNDLHQRYTATTHGLDVVVSGFHSSIGIQGTLAAEVNATQIAAAREMLQQLEVSELESVELRHMSSGQQRRCLLARSLIHRPATLILDEPTAGLDLAASFSYLKRIRQLAADGCSIVLVTHYLNEIPPEIDRVVLLQAGQIVADGPKRDVLRPTILSAAYETPIRVAEVDSYFLAYPGN